MDIAEKKSNLRIVARSEIDALPDDYIASSNRGLFERVLSLKEYSDARSIMLYYSIGREPDTLEIAKDAFKRGKTVTFPYCFRGGLMRAGVVTSLDELTPAMLGIPAPAETSPIVAPEALDIVIVPALVYDRSGYRLGYGGGYYDRFLRGIPAFSIGPCRQRLLRDEVPRHAHDIAVRCLITEENFFVQ